METLYLDTGPGMVVHRIRGDMTLCGLCWSHVEAPTLLSSEYPADHHPDDACDACEAAS